MVNKALFAEWIPLTDSEAINQSNWRDHWKLCDSKGSCTIRELKGIHPEYAVPGIILSCLSKGGWIERPQYNLEEVEGWELVDAGNGRRYLSLYPWVLTDDGRLRRGDKDFALIPSDQIVSHCVHIRKALEASKALETK